MSAQAARRLPDPILIPLIILTTLSLPILLPVLVPILIATGWLTKRRRRQAASSFPCIRCGFVLGDQAVDLADRAWQAYCDRERSRGVYCGRMRDRSCHAICVGCGTRYTCIPQEHTFVIETPQG